MREANEPSNEVQQRIAVHANPARLRNAVLGARRRQEQTPYASFADPAHDLSGHTGVKQVVFGAAALVERIDDAHAAGGDCAAEPRRAGHELEHKL